MRARPPRPCCSSCRQSRYLERFSFPAIVVGGEMRIVAVNEAAATLVSREPRSVTGMFAGNALECAYARLPGGCGRSEHCASCAIRNTITRTHETGEAMSCVPAALELGGRSVRLSMSSVRVRDLVRVRLEPDDGSPDRPPSVD